MTTHDLISIRDLSNTGIAALFSLADEFAGSTRRRLGLARGAVMTTLFFEPSTRTRMSFEAAMLRLGGQVISMADPAASSAAKGETLADTVRIVEAYADIIVLRHPRDGAARVAADFAGAPVINAGDGAREHPTQTLLDLYTLYREKGKLDGLTIALCGDLKHGRTVHSLAQGCARFGINMVCIAPAGLELPPHLHREITEQHGVSITHFPSFDEAPLADCDALYVTRIQKERFQNPDEFERVRSSYQVSPDTLTRARTDAIVLHPLPRVDELAYSLDGDPRAAYFRQAAYGVPMRMALVAVMLGLKPVSDFYQASDKRPDQEDEGWHALPADKAFACANPRCITRDEPGVPRWAFIREDGARRCAYCEQVQEAACPAS